MSEKVTAQLKGRGEVAGVVGNFISWERFEEVFHDARELASDERLVKVVADRHGIRYFVERIPVVR